jgi:hypothetical protein
MDRCEEVWYSSDRRKKPKADRKPTGRLSMAVLCHGLEKNGMVRAWHGRGMGMAWQV